jgi:hypothetical protein
MIKMSGTSKTGRKLVILGLSEMNLVRLREKKPLVVYGAEVGVPEMETLFICWGETEDTLTKEFSVLVGDTTRMRDLRNEKKN